MITKVTITAQADTPGSSQKLCQSQFSPDADSRNDQPEVPPFEPVIVTGRLRAATLSQPCKCPETNGYIGQRAKDSPGHRVQSHTDI